jgi:hypothetical protein
MRIADYFKTGEPPPGLTDDERAYVDGIMAAYERWSASVPGWREPAETAAAPGG